MPTDDFVVVQPEEKVSKYSDLIHDIEFIDFITKLVDLKVKEVVEIKFGVVRPELTDTYPSDCEEDITADNSAIGTITNVSNSSLLSDGVFVVSGTYNQEDSMEITKSVINGGIIEAEAPTIDYNNILDMCKYFNIIAENVIMLINTMPIRTSDDTYYILLKFKTNRPIKEIEYSTEYFISSIVFLGDEPVLKMAFKDEILSITAVNKFIDNVVHKNFLISGEFIEWIRSNHSSYDQKISFDHDSRELLNLKAMQISFIAKNVDMWNVYHSVKDIVS